MTIDRFILGLAGTMVLLSLVLYLAHSPWWLLLTALVGINLLQSAITGYCPSVKLLKRLGIKPGKAFD